MRSRDAPLDTGWPNGVGSLFRLETEQLVQCYQSKKEKPTPSATPALRRAEAVQSVLPARLSKVSKVRWPVVSKLSIGWAVLARAARLVRREAGTVRRGEPANIVPPKDFAPVVVASAATHWRQASSCKSSLVTARVRDDELCASGHNCGGVRLGRLIRLLEPDCFESGNLNGFDRSPPAMLADASSK
jgi:hypothetical protein